LISGFVCVPWKLKQSWTNNYPLRTGGAVLSQTLQRFRN